MLLTSVPWLNNSRHFRPITIITYYHHHHYYLLNIYKIIGHGSRDKGGEGPPWKEIVLPLKLLQTSLSFDCNQVPRVLEMYFWKQRLHLISSCSAWFGQSHNKMTFPFEKHRNSIWYLSLPHSELWYLIFWLQYHCFQTESNEKYIKELNYRGWH